MSWLKDTIRQVSQGIDWLKAMPFVLFFLAIFSYGLLIPWMGFYWDDFPVAWIADRLGPDGLERYFFNNRPMLSYLYQVTVPIFGTQIPWHWHVFALITRFTASLAFFWLIRSIWIKNPRLAVWAGLFVLVYPGFKQQWVSIIYGHFFLILTGLFLSFSLSIRVARSKARFVETTPEKHIAKDWKNRLLGFIAWLLALQNLFFLDYFFFLELIRPVLLWAVFEESVPDRKKRVWKVFRAWLPYLVLITGFVLWRFITLQSRPHLYQITLFNRLQEAPLSALVNLGINILRGFWISIPVAWGMVFQPPDYSAGFLTITATLILVGLVFAGLMVYLLLLKHRADIESVSNKEAGKAIGVGLLACLLAGWSIWFPELEVGTRFPGDRFSLVFLPGSALVLAGAIGVFSARHTFSWFLVSLIVSLAVGQQFLAANAFRRDWEYQQRMFWQLAWRAPALETGTLLLSDDLPFTYYTDNSLTAAINWFYAPNNTSPRMQYLLFYPSQRLGTKLPALKPGIPLLVDYLAATFEGSTSQVVGFVFKPPACLRILEPELDVENKMIAENLRLTAILSSVKSILPDSQERIVELPAELYGEEPSHNWCYFYEKADLARQRGEWAQVVALGEQAEAYGDYPNDPMERLPFIEANAQVGNWEKAVEITRKTQAITPMMEPVLCRLWKRISNSTAESVEKDVAYQAVLNEMSCSQE